MTTHVKSAMVVCIASCRSPRNCSTGGPAAIRPGRCATVRTDEQTGRPGYCRRPGSVAPPSLLNPAPRFRAQRTLRGGVERQALAGTDGVATLLNIPREHTGPDQPRRHVTFEKEVTCAGARATAEAAMTAAPTACRHRLRRRRKRQTVSVSVSVRASWSGGRGEGMSLTDLAEKMLDEGAARRTRDRVFGRDRVAAHPHPRNADHSHARGR